MSRACPKGIFDSSPDIGGVAVVVGELVEAEEPPFEVVVCCHGAVVCGADLADRVDDAAAQLVVQVAAVLRGAVGPQAVEHLLFVQQGVVDEGADVGVPPQSPGDRRGRPPAGVAVGIVEQHEDFTLRFLDRSPLFLYPEPGPRVDLGGEAGESAPPRVGGLDEDLFFRFAEIVRRHPPLMVEVVPVGGQLRSVLDAIVRLQWNAADLEVEEDQVGGRGAVEFARLLQQPPARRIGGVGRVEQTGVSPRFVLQGQQILVVGQGLAKMHRGEAGNGDRAFVLPVELLRPPGRFPHVAVETRIVAAGIEVGQVPGREGCGLLRGLGHWVLLFKIGHTTMGNKSSWHWYRFDQDSALVPIRSGQRIGTDSIRTAHWYRFDQDSGIPAPRAAPLLR